MDISPGHYFPSGASFLISNAVAFRRFNTGRLVCNLDSVTDNVFTNCSELGLCGRPLSDDSEIFLPLSKDMFLPESLEAEADLKQAERQRPSTEACQAQKGTQRWVALLQSLLTINGDNLKAKPCIVLNLTGYIEDVGCAVSWQNYWWEFECRGNTI